jgi:hypothetical protein
MKYKITTASGKDYIFESEQSYNDMLLDIDIKNHIIITEHTTIFTRHIESVKVV